MEKYAKIFCDIFARVPVKKLGPFPNIFIKYWKYFSFITNVISLLKNFYVILHLIICISKNYRKHIFFLKPQKKFIVLRGGGALLFYAFPYWSVLQSKKNPFLSTFLFGPQIRFSFCVPSLFIYVLHWGKDTEVVDQTRVRIRLPELYPGSGSNSKCSGSATLCQYAVAILKTKKQQLIKKRVKKIIGNDWTQNLYEKVATLTSTFLPTFAIRLKNRSRFPIFFFFRQFRKIIILART